MAVMNWQDIDQKAKQWIKEAGAYIRQSFADQINVDYKTDDSDLVTNMDRNIEQFFIGRIHDHYPGHRILSEEGYGDEIVSMAGTIWIIDPIDGTMNFVHQQRYFAVSIGVYHEGVGIIGLIYDVVGDELFHCISGEGAYVNGMALNKRAPVRLQESLVGLNATWITKNHRIDPNILAPLVQNVRGTRSYGTAAIELAYIAANRLDAYFSLRIAPWDIAAGKILLEEVGARMTRIDGSPVDMLQQNTLCAGEAQLHQEIIDNYIQKGVENHLYIDG